MSPLNRIFAAALFVPFLVLSGSPVSAAAVNSSSAAAKMFGDVILDHPALFKSGILQIRDRGRRGSHRGVRGHRGRGHVSRGHRYRGGRGHRVRGYTAYRKPRIRRGHGNYVRSGKVYRGYKYDRPRHYKRKFRYVGKVKPYYRAKRYYRYAAPYVVYSYGYYGPCEGLKRRAYYTDDPYWWAEYERCLDYYYY